MSLVILPRRTDILLEYVEVTERNSYTQVDQWRQAQIHRSRRNKYKDAMSDADTIPEAYTGAVAEYKKMAKKNTRKRYSAD